MKPLSGVAEKYRGKLTIMNAAVSLMLFVSVLVPSKGWYAPQ
jgi:hypothetical protein